jgi:hypothetical protein
MSLAVAVPLGIASAVVYGVSIVVQHRRANSGSGEENAGHLLSLLRDPIWLLAIGGDLVGFLLQIGALATGPVVVIQPLVVLMLPVSLLAAALLGGPRPQFGDYLGSVAVIGGLSLFLAMLDYSTRRHTRIPHTPNGTHLAFAVLGVVVVGVALCLAVRGRGATLRGAMYGGVAGACFGTLGVLVNTAAHRLIHRDVHELLTTRSGIVTVSGIVLVGGAGIVLTQISFQVGALGATLPANLVTDPVTAVILGSVLLRERVPTGPGYLLVYVLCVGAVVAGAIRLAAPATAPIAPRAEARL